VKAVINYRVPCNVENFSNRRETLRYSRITSCMHLVGSK